MKRQIELYRAERDAKRTERAKKELERQRNVIKAAQTQKKRLSRLRCLRLKMLLTSHYTNAQNVQCSIKPAVLIHQLSIWVGEGQSSSPTHYLFGHPINK